MFYTYILYSDSTDRYYIGYTSDLEDRIRHHNTGATKTTRRGMPWKIVYHESYSNKLDAIIREREIKKKKSRKYIECLISQCASHDNRNTLYKITQKIKMIDK